MIIAVVFIKEEVLALQCIKTGLPCVCKTLSTSCILPYSIHLPWSPTRCRRNKARTAPGEADAEHILFRHCDSRNNRNVYRQKRWTCCGMGSQPPCCAKSSDLSWTWIPSWTGPSIDHMALARSSEQTGGLHIKDGKGPTTHSFLHLVLNVTPGTGA